MKLDLSIIGLDEFGDSVRVKAQGPAIGDADWQPLRVIEVTVPPHIGRRYQIGQRIVVTITPGKKP